MFALVELLHVFVLLIFDVIATERVDPPVKFFVENRLESSRVENLLESSCVESPLESCCGCFSWCGCGGCCGCCSGDVHGDGDWNDDDDVCLSVCVHYFQPLHSAANIVASLLESDS